MVQNTATLRLAPTTVAALYPTGPAAGPDPEDGTYAELTPARADALLASAGAPADVRAQVAAWLAEGNRHATQVPGRGLAIEIRNRPTTAQE